MKTGFKEKTDSKYWFGIYSINYWLFPAAAMAKQQIYSIFLPFSYSIHRPFLFSVCMGVRPTRASRVDRNNPCSCSHSVPANCHNRLHEKQHPANLTMKQYSVCYLSGKSSKTSAGTTDNSSIYSSASPTTPISRQREDISDLHDWAVLVGTLLASARARESHFPLWFRRKGSHFCISGMVSLLCSTNCAPFQFCAVH